MTETPPGTDPLVVSPPAFDAATAKAIAEQHFGETGEITELGGERDQNFRLDTAEESYVLKISNRQDGPETLDLQAAAIEHVSATSDLPVMQVVPTVDDEPWATVSSEGETHLVRLFTYLPGVEHPGGELSETALFEYGASVATVGEALRGFFHPEARYEILWDLRYAPDLRALVSYVDDGERRALAERVLDRIDERVAPVFDSLRAQVIHNDLTLDNVVLDHDGRVSGVVDFGDLTHTALVCDLAIALASVMHRRSDPLEAAETVVRGYASVTPLEEEEARLLGDLVAARLLSWGVIVAWRAAEHPEKTDHTTAGVDEGWALLGSLDAQGFDAVGRRLRTAALSSAVPYESLETTALRSRRREVLGDAPLSYREPVHFRSGDGVWLVDTDGNRYLDAYNNVQVVGHGNPRVAAAIEGQARKLATNTRYLHEAVVELSERLLSTLPPEFDRVMLVNSGSEANDLAWRLATAATGNSGAVVSGYAYHGITDVTVDLSPDIWPEGTHPEYVETVPPPAKPDTHRGASLGDAGEAMAGALGRLGRRGHDPAAFVFDTLFTSDGIYPPDGSRLAAMADRIHDAGGLVIADEVQSGFGRTGANLWGYQATDVVPDIVTMGKPMGNGHPVAAVATRSELTAPLMDRTGLFSTFGGNPVSSVAALAVLDVIEEQELLAQVEDVGGALHDELTELAAKHDLVGEVRQQGLMVGIELVSDADWTPASEATKAVVEELRQRRVLIGSASEAGNVLKIRPPLVFEHGHAERLVDALDTVLADVGSE